MKNTALRFLISLYSFTLDIIGTPFCFLCAKLPFATNWNLAERSRGPQPKDGMRISQSVWVHAASLGEAKLLIQFLDILRIRHPDAQYLITATTKNGVAHLRANDAPDICGIGFLPLDTRSRMRTLVKAFGVSRVWLMETELWPSMLFTCLSQNIPVGLVNARIEEKSLASYRRFAMVVGALFSNLDIVLAQNATYADRFHLLGIARERIHIVGNLKSRITIEPPIAAERAETRRKLILDNNDICITAGCVHEGEGIVIKQALDMLYKQEMRVKCIVVPRHLHETTVLNREFGCGCVVLADVTSKQPWQICIINKIGILDPLYACADAAIIGGTFDTTGGHNMWDAARYGIPVFFGPAYHTQQESGDNLKKSGVGFLCTNAKELADTIADVLTSKHAEYIQAQELFTKTINENQFSIESILP